MAPGQDNWEPVIGLEIHAQLVTHTKLFCGCLLSFGDAPNTHCCPVCLGLPGALPVLNAEAVRLGLMASLALGCTIRRRSVFARKNYFYPDLPKGYQISQYQEPLAEHGAVRLERAAGGRKIGVTRLHLEEDAGKTIHRRGADSAVDLNRAGTPLAEIVSEPDLRSPSEARAYMRTLRERLLFAGVSDGNLEQGSLRCDANVSVRRRGEPELGTKVELKNINSFRFVEQALEDEIARQIGLLERGETIVQQTRGYDADRGNGYLLREKEGDAGYRYFAEPDLPPLVIDDAELDLARARLPEMPDDKRARFVAEAGLSEQAAGVLTTHPRVATFFEEAATLSGQPVRTANFVQAEVLRDVHTDGLGAELPLSAQQLAGLIALVAAGEISGKQAKHVYAAMKGTDQRAAAIVAKLGLAVIRDEATLRDHARRIVAAHPAPAASYRNGKRGLLGFFVGQLMKATGSSADPELGSALLQAELDGAPATTEQSAGDDGTDGKGREDGGASA